jgi:predicted MFS family arabinose efflux permease
MPTQSAPLRKTLTWTLFRNTERLGFLLVLFLITTSHYLDGNILSVLLEPIKHEFAVSDTKLGLLVGLCFSLIYAIAGSPLALWADRGDRRKIIALAVAGWSLMTALCGMAHSFVQLALARFGVGALASAGIPLSQSICRLQTGGNQRLHSDCLGRIEL